MQAVLESQRSAAVGLLCTVSTPVLEHILCVDGKVLARSDYPTHLYEKYGIPLTGRSEREGTQGRRGCDAALRPGGWVQARCVGT